MTNQRKTALLLTGAAARISQEVAIIDGLIANHSLKLSPDNTYVAGFSSGSLNLLAINACFKTNPQMQWDADYKQNTLFNLKTSQVYSRNGHLPFDTSPLRKTLNEFLTKAGFEILSDYPFMSHILVFSDRKFKTLWPLSTNADQKDIYLSDLHMSSTAIPLVFPWQEIDAENGETGLPGGHFMDGGTGGTFKHFEDNISPIVAQNGIFDEMYVISPMREDECAEHENLLSGIQELEGFNVESRIKDFLGNLSQKGFVKFLKELSAQNKATPMAKEIYVCIPELEKNYPLINFDLQKPQYDDTMAWITNEPESLAIPINEYLKTMA